MAESYKEVQRKLFSSEFNKFFRKKISLYLGKIEKLRKKYLLFVYIIAAIALFPIIISFIYFFIDYESLLLNVTRYGNFIFIIEFSLVLSIFFIIKKYKNKVKPLILPRLLSFAGDFRIIDKNSPEYNVRPYVSSLELFSFFNRYSCDDRIEGMYKNIKISISEILLRKETGSGKRRRIVTIFDGLLVKVPCLKKYKGTTYIKRNGICLDFSGNKVNLEDPEFEKYYDVYSSDQIEARYLITTAFMNRMVELAKKGIGQNITLSFEHGNVNIAVASSKDWFELPIMKSANDIMVYRAIILEIITILSIIDSLKLDVNIGL